MGEVVRIKDGKPYVPLRLVQYDDKAVADAREIERRQYEMEQAMAGLPCDVEAS